MKLSQLEALIAIADGHGIAGAADKLNISQPAITKSLSNLEHELGVDLLDRSEYRLKLNAYGEMLLGRARAIAAESEKAVADLQRMRDLGQQLIRVNCTPGTIRELIPLALEGARKEMPGLLFEFEGAFIANPETKYKGLSDGLYDLLIYAVEELHDISDFDCEPLMDVQMIILASKGHPALKIKNPSIKDLANFNWLTNSREGRPHRLLQEAFSAAGLRIPDTMLFLPMTEMIYSLLRYGEYLAFVPYHPAILTKSEFSVIDAGLPDMHLQMHLLQRKSSSPSKAMRTFIKNLKQIVALSEP